jgi:ATP-dependent DNA helicase RecG
VTIGDPVTLLPGIGPKRAERLARLGIRTREDVLRHAPRAYEERGALVSIEEARARPPGAFATIRGRIARRSLFGARGRSVLRCLVEDETGTMEVLWFHARFLAKDLATGALLAASGRISRDGRLLQPEFALLERGSDGVPERLLGIRPLYPLTDGVTQRVLRELVGHCLDGEGALEDPLPPDVRDRAGVLPLAEAVRAAHRPRDLAEADGGRERLLFDEILAIELAMRRRAGERACQTAPPKLAAGGGARAFVERLPFALSESQRTAVEDVVRDLAGERPMHRMLTGEVGSGKTAVALAAVEEARSRGWQSALLAPTDLLARQHERTAADLLPRGAEGVALLTGTVPAAAARDVRARLASGRIDFVIGTHALLSEATGFARLGIVVVDEEHRFGVEQRETLRAKASAPHVLVMTATPIPRSLALLAWGDGDVSRLDPRPAAQGEITTRVVPRRKRAAALRWTRERLARGEQAFFVRPRIEGADEGAEELHAELSRAFPGLEVGLVHGRIPAAEREESLARFRDGEIAAIVATTVVEVGIDVPGATILWVEGAERLGLATLHQLRGRVARRGQRGYCWVVEGPDAPEGSRERLDHLVEVHDGMRLAEIDLAFRGPGELLGLRQSGHVGLFAGLGRHGSGRLASLVERAWRAAETLLEREGEAPWLRTPASLRSSD